MATDDPAAEAMTFSSVLCGVSPYRREDNDESSVDIYDGLDNTPIASVNLPTEASPVGGSLNLFEEILIAEGTTKEASYNDLQARHDKCLQQLQELMKKLQEIQEQNSTLQNENQTLKKNISALIKTARVEINRKDEEINNLQRRLLGFPVHQNAYRRTYVAAPIKNARNSEGLKNDKCNSPFPENNPKTDPRTKTSCDTENQKFYSEKRNTPHVPRSPPELLYKDANSTLTNISNSSEKEKGKKEIRHDEHHSKENDCRYKNKGYQNVGSITEAKLHINPEKPVRLFKGSKNSTLKSGSYSEQRTDAFPSASEKQSPNDQLPSKTEHCGNDRGEKSQNIKQKDLKTQNEGESSSSTHKTRPTERNLEQQRRKGNNSSSPPEKKSRSEKLSKSYVEDKKLIDSCNRKKRGTNNHEFQGRRPLSPPPPTSNKKHKRSHSKDESRKHESQSTNSEAETHRTEEKRKKERVTLGDSKTSQAERTDSKEKTAKLINKVKDHTTREQSKPFPSQEITKIRDSPEEQKLTKVKRDEDQSKSKDLKLSFMQKLNLTLSPAKIQTGELREVEQPTSERDGEIPGELLSTSAAKQKTSQSVPVCDSPAPSNAEQMVFISESEANVTVSLPKILSTEISKEPSDQQNTMQCALADNLPEASIETGDAEETHRLPNLGSPLDQDTLSDNFNETIRSVDFDSYSVIDEIDGTDSDSLVEVEGTGKCEGEIVVEQTKKENNCLKIVPLDAEGRSKVLSMDVSVTDQKPHNSEPNCLDQGSHLEKFCKKGVNSVPLVKDICPVDDDNSVLSIDLNHMRYIPKAISPLNSPIRPLAKALRGESAYTGLAKSYNLDPRPESAADCSPRNLSSELNKENQKPFCPDPQVVKIEFQLSVSSDELEEGEIVSDDDNLNSERKSEYSKKSRGKASSERSSFTNSPHNQKSKTVSYNKDKEKLAPAKNSKGKPRTGTIRSSKETKKNKSVKIYYLEKIVQITAEPSTMHEFMQMLKAIRKQVRKNYMKFKVKFPIHHFHRIIDSAILNFTSLVKYLNFSKMSKSNETLKLNLCEVIESRLKRIKRNGAVDHLFDQQQPDMKKKLWKLVDEHLDNLFDKIKKILLELCNLKNTGNENGDGKPKKRIKDYPKELISHKSDGHKPKKPSLNIRTQKAEEHVLPKPVVGNGLSKRGHHDTSKIDAQNNVDTKCTSSCTDSGKRSRTRVEFVKEKSIQDTELALKIGKCEEGSQLVENSHKSDISCGPLTEQQMSGLTFNLVNDAQMGEMFKSLLQGSAFSEKNSEFMDESQWEFRTPEKHLLGEQNCGNDTVFEAEEAFPKETRIESRILDGIKWPVVSPERDSAFLTRLPMPVDPDILDENCMFDIPSSPALKKSEACILEKPKSLVSSILLEDLAVSLTIPSPLKSDAHLSFLKPDVLGSVPEDVLSAHLSEDARLDEEDASEQDIHLALESDNSSSKSSCSSSWPNMPAAPGFQYCASLPMQAVIMEKSNDHFIVKIRRAVPSVSPRLDQASLAVGSLASFIERGNYESVSEEKIATSDSKGLPLEEIIVSKEQNDITDSEDKLHDNVEKEHAPCTFEAMKEPSACYKKNQVPDLSEAQQESNPSAPDNTPESVEDLFSHARQGQDCNMPEPLHEPSSSLSHHQGTDLIEVCPVLHSSFGPEETSDFPDPPKEGGKSPSSSVSFIEPSNKACHSQDLPDVFKLPQIHSLKVLQQRDVSYATAKQLPVSSAVVPLVDVFSSESHFDTDVDLPTEPPMVNEVDSWDLTAHSALKSGTGSLRKEEDEPAGCCAADDLLKSDDAVKSSTAELSDKPAAGANFVRKAALNLGSPIPCKESKKRKREMEETSSTKRLSCEKNSKSSKKSKESVSVTKSSSRRKALSIRDKDPSPRTLSVSPSSLYAKNIVKKKGEVIISWTRNDDREILLECQKKGPSEKTFSSIAARLNKSSSQVEERLKQLVKLFNMSNCS